MVLDVMLPDMEGFEVAERLGAERGHVPILFLTARDASEDKLRGLTTGGDDYMTKPFSLEELVARIRNILRRTGHAEPDSSRLVFEDLELDEDTREVTRGGEPVELTATEYRLLRYLMLNPRRVLTRGQILDHVWDYDFGGDARVLETYISYLRKKLDRHGPPLIHTVARGGLRAAPAEALSRVAPRAPDRDAPRPLGGRAGRARGGHLRLAALVPAAARGRPDARRPAGAGASAREAGGPTTRPRRSERGPAARATAAPTRRRRTCPPGTYGERRDAGGKRVGDVRRAHLRPDSAAHARPAGATSSRPAVTTVDAEGRAATCATASAPRATPDGGSTIVAIPLQRRGGRRSTGCCWWRRW